LNSCDIILNTLLYSSWNR